MKSVFVFPPLRKHLAGQHDQSSHGSWAGEKLDEKRVALVKEVEKIRSNWSQVVAVPSDIAIKILSGERYTSVFESKNSENSQSRTRMEERLSIEETVLGIPKDAPSSERPVYGYMADTNKKLVPNLIGEIGYGDVYFVLNPDVKNRSTMTMGDSIQITGKAFPLTGKITSKEIQSGYAWGDWNRGYFPFWEDYPETQISGGFSISDVSEIIVSPTFRSNTNEIGIIQQKSQDAGISFSSNVTKHQAGQHDQSSHGSWATGKDAITHKEKFEFTDDDGVKTSVNFQDFLTEEEQKDFLSIVKDLKKTTDLSGWDEVNIVLSNDSRRYSNFTTLGETISYFKDTSYRENGTYIEDSKLVSDIYLKPESFQKKEPDFFDRTSWMKRSMEGKVTSVGEYLLAHEWGHVVDFARIFIDSTPTPESRDEAKFKGDARKKTFFASAEKDLSWYGKTSLAEFYAEAYADWFMNDGKDSYPWMEKMAQEEKWKK